MTRCGKTLAVLVLTALTSSFGVPPGSRPAAAESAAAPPTLFEVALTLTPAPPSVTPGTDPEATGWAWRVRVTARGLGAGHVEWTAAGDQDATPGRVRLTNTAGDEVLPLETGPGRVAALVEDGDWTLDYTLPAPAGSPGTAATPGSPIILRPAALVLLPGGPGRGLTPLTLSVAGPEGWAVVANVIDPSGLPLPGPFPSAWLEWMSFFLGPTPPAAVGTVEVNGLAIEVLTCSAATGGAPGGTPPGGTADAPGENPPAGGNDAPPPEALLATAVSAAAAFAARVGLPRDAVSGQIRFLLPARADLMTVGMDALDTLWLLALAKTGPALAVSGDAAGGVSPGDASGGLSPDTAGLAFLYGGLWPLARYALLADVQPPEEATAAAEAALARRLWNEAEAYQKLTTPPPPLKAAPLASAYFLGNALGLDGPALLGLARDAFGQPGGVLGALSRAADDAGPAARALYAQLQRGDSLPELPAEIVALADPDTDGDGLPDRLDPEPLVKGISVVVAGRTIRWDVPPLTVAGRVMVPLRLLAEDLGFEVFWDNVARRATVRRGADEAVFPVGSYTFVARGESRRADAPATIVDGRVLVPLRFVAWGLDAWISWDQASLTVTVDPLRPYPGDGAGAGVGEGPAILPPPGSRTAYLTFDDGPNPSMTPRVLDVLAAKEVRATFFVVGGCAARCPGTLRAIVEGGHALGNHTYSHNLDKVSPGWVYRSPEAYLDELAACDGAIAAATGLHPRVSRAPGGSYPYLTQEFRDALAREGYVTYDWDISAADSAVPRPTAEEIVKRITAVAAEPGRTRLIVLMHDGGSDHESTLEALPALIDRLRELGYGFAMLGG